MALHILPHQMITMIGAVITLILTLIAWPRRNAVGGGYFVAFCILVTFWLITSTIESMVTEPEVKIFWSQVLYIGFSQAYPLLFVFLISYVRQVKIPIHYVLALMVIPDLTLIVAWTNQYHGWLWSGFVQGSRENNVLIYYHGFWYYVFIAYLYLLFLAALVYLIIRLKNAPHAFRSQIVILLVGLSFPILTGTLYVLGLEPVKGLDITPTGLVFTSLFLVWGLLRFQMLDLLPIARTVLVEQLKVGVVVLDIKGRIVDINQAACAMLSWDSRQVIGVEIKRISMILAGYFDKAGNLSRQVITIPGTPDHILEVQLSVLNGRDREKLGSLMILQDVTEQKRAEEALRASESLTRAITDVAQDAIIMIDPEGFISFWNPAAERIFGYARAEALGQKLHRFIVPARYLEKHLAHFPNFQESSNSAVMGRIHEVEAVRKDGSEIPIRLSLSSLNLNGNWYAVGLMSDITERKQAERTLQETITQLEDSIKQAKLLTVQAETANIAKSEFLANMSHEIRTPMNGVIGMTGLLLDTDLDDEQRRYTEIVRSSGEALLALINDILDLSKIEAGKLELETLDFDLSSMLDDFASAMAVRAYEKGLEFLCAASPDVPALLRGDPGRLRQILTNLAGNAIKFTHHGEVSVRASLISTLDKAVVLRFAIRDTGIGIPPEKIGALFEKFYQVDASTTRHFGGTGLGLAISKQLAEMMGGEIGVTSEPEHGSEFWFTIRIGLQPARQEPLALAFAGLEGVRVLIVDDNATSREILSARLKSWGMRPSEASGGAEALSALETALEEEDLYRMAILDMQMPGMDGAMLGQTIKNDSRYNQILLVLLSSLGERGDARRFHDLGFSGYLVKPVRHSDLYDVLSAALGTGEKLTGADAAAAQDQPIITRHATREYRRAYPGSAARVLLVEDNITNQQVALGILRRYQYKVDAVASGVEALKSLERIPYDLVLMDVQMPEMDGLEATRCIRAEESLVLDRAIPIIAMTAHALQGDRDRCLAAGMDDYITKPVKPETLIAILERWLPLDVNHPQASSEFLHHPGVDNYEPAENALFDPGYLRDSLMGDSIQVSEILAEYTQDTPRQIRGLKDSLQTGDVDSTIRHAHSMKGAASLIGAGPLRDLTAKMERMAKDGDLDGVRSRLDDLDDLFERLRQALESEIRRLRRM